MKNSTREKIRNLALKYAVLDYILLEDGQTTSQIYDWICEAVNYNKGLYPVNAANENITPLAEYEYHLTADMLSMIDDQANSYELFFSEGLSIIIDDVKG